MIVGRSFWIFVWYVILVLGVLGLWAGLYWGRQTKWKNLDEVFRGIGTIAVSVGMLLLLYAIPGWAGEAFLSAALVAFAAAFVWGRRHPVEPHPHEDTADLDDEP